jgi:hypothetical protein
VIGKVADPGKETIGLLDYLYRLSEHHKDPHVIGGFQPASVLEPPLRLDGRPDLRQLADVLEASLALADTSRLKDDRLVCHFSFRAADGDRRLDDDEWMVIARETMPGSGSPRAAARTWRSRGW